MSKSQAKKLKKHPEWRKIHQELKKAADKVRRKTNRFVIGGGKIVTVSAVVLALFLDSGLSIIFAFESDEIGSAYARLLKAIQEGHLQRANDAAESLYELLLVEAGSLPALNFLEFWQTYLAPKLQEEIKKKKSCQ